MSVGYNPKNDLTAEQSLKVQELTIRQSDQGLYSLTAYSGTGCLIYIREPVLSQQTPSAPSMTADGVYIVRVKVDSSNTWTEFQHASLSLVDSKSSTGNNTTSGFNEMGVAVQDQGAILVTGLTSLATSDVIIVRYVVQEHL